MTSNFNSQQIARYDLPKPTPLNQSRDALTKIAGTPQSPGWTFPQVTSLGSADPKWQIPNDLVLRIPTGEMPPPMHPLISDFTSLVNDPNFTDKIARDPRAQAALFDIDNVVKSNSGIHRTEQDGLVEMGTEKDGRPLYASPQLQGDNANNFKIGESQLTNTGHVLDVMGAFRTTEEAQSFVARTKLSGSPQFMGQLTAQISGGDKKGAVNTIMSQMGHPSLDQVGKSKDPIAVGTAFAAHNTVENWDKMTNSQRSMALSGLSIASYKYDDGRTLNDRVLIAPSVPGDPHLTVGTALSLASAGVDIPQLMKHWDQLDAMQRLTYGKGTASQLAVTGQQLGMLGQADFQGKTVNVSAAQLGAAGYKAVPSAGVGAIIGPEGSLPSGYTVVGAGKSPNTVIAVPVGHEGTAATIKGASNIVSLNTNSGALVAGQNTFQVYQRWGGASQRYTNGVVGGTQATNGLTKATDQNPYLKGSVVALSTVGTTQAAQRMTTHKEEKNTKLNVLNKGAAGYGAYDKLTGGSNSDTVSTVVKGVNIAFGEGTDKEKAVAGRRAAEDAVANYWTGGLFGVGRGIDAHFFGGKGEKFREKSEKYNPAAKFSDKAAAWGFSKEGGTSNKQHIDRNEMRRGLQNIQLIDKDYNITLADGTKVNMGYDDKDGSHEFRDTSLVPEGNEIRTLHAYDVDYTNDLDYSANIMSASLMRLVSGGKGTGVDQIASQLANASIANVGYGQDMTEANYAKAQANMRGFFAQSGIKSKEDAYALANQAFSEGRLNEMDLVQMHQGIDMTFDKNGFNSAQQMMPGRHKGIAVAADMTNPPGPHLQFSQIPPLLLNGQAQGQPTFLRGVASGLSQDEAELKAAEKNTTPGMTQSMQLISGNYGGPATAGMYNTELNRFVDPYANQQYHTQVRDLKIGDMSRANIKSMNESRYGR